MAGVVVQIAIDRGCLHVKQALGAGSFPAHLLFLAKPPVDQLIHRRLDVGRSNSFTTAERGTVTRDGLAVRVEV